MSLGLQYDLMSSKKVERRTRQFDLRELQAFHIILVLHGSTAAAELAARNMMLKAQAKPSEQRRAALQRAVQSVKVSQS